MRARPDFSIIVPTFNRPRQLADCLDSLTHLVYPCSDFEVIVVDDGSNYPVASDFASYHDRLNLTFCSQKKRGPASARNAGAAKAKGRYLAFTDDDCLPAADWLQELENTLNTSSRKMVGGRTINALPDNAFSTASQCLVSYLYDYYNIDKGNARFLASNNVAVPAEPFRLLGGFDPGYPNAAAEDRDFCHRWRLSGHGILYAPDAIVYHRHHLTLRAFWKQQFNYGRGASRFHQVCIWRSKQRHGLEPLSFYIRLMRYPFVRTRDPRPLLIAFLLALSQIGNAAGFCRGRANH